MVSFCQHSQAYELCTGPFLTASPYYSEYSYSITACPQNASVEIPEWSFSLKKSPCGNSTQQHRACKILGWSFSPKKSPCGNSTQQHRACQIPGWSFSRKKSPCGNSTKQHGACQVPTKVAVCSKNIKFGPKWIENQRFGLKIGPNESHGLSEAIQTTPVARIQ